VAVAVLCTGLHQQAARVVVAQEPITQPLPLQMEAQTKAVAVVAVETMPLDQTLQ